jgi:hypothetical protein
MKYTIQAGSAKRAKAIFILTGSFLILLFSYQLYDYLQTNEFVAEFPGDWDKPIGIAVGVFVLIRSRKFSVDARDVFVKIAGNELSYRVARSDSIRKIDLSTVEKIREKGKVITLTTKDSTKLTIADFNKVRIKDDKRESITKSLIEINKDLNPKGN